MGVRAAISAVFLVLVPVAGTTQETGAPLAGPVRSAVLTIASERLFAETRFGQRIQSDLRARADALASENESLQAELTAEEQSLTERRPNMEVDAFRAEAEAFDVRVQAIRNEQDAKQRALEQAVEESRGTFINAVRPVLGGLMIQSGAAVILEQRQVVLSASLIDITDEAIAAINAELGDGTDRPASVPAGGAAPSRPVDPVRGAESDAAQEPVAPDTGPVEGDDRASSAEDAGED